MSKPHNLVFPHLSHRGLASSPLVPKTPLGVLLDFSVPVVLSVPARSVSCLVLFPCEVIPCRFLSAKPPLCLIWTSTTASPPARPTLCLLACLRSQSEWTWSSPLSFCLFWKRPSSKGLLCLSLPQSAHHYIPPLWPHNDTCTISYTLSLDSLFFPHQDKDFLSLRVWYDTAGAL